MNINEHERLFNFTLKTKIEVKEQCFLLLFCMLQSHWCVEFYFPDKKYVY